MFRNETLQNVSCMQCINANPEGTHADPSYSISDGALQHPMEAQCCTQGKYLQEIHAKGCLFELFHHPLSDTLSI
jgi:hypothetical protein